MAAEAFKLLGTIVVDASKAEQTISKTADHAENAGTRIANAFKKIGTAIVTHLALNRIADFGKECLELAASVQAVESQFSQVFSDSAFGSLEKEATASLKSISKEAGIATNRLKGSFVKIASFAKTTGMDTAEALNLTERAMIAAADSSAFLDRSIEDTTATLMSFLKGNYENDAALNLSCTEITRNAAANALYGKSFIELSEAQKQLTLLQMVEDANRLSGAMGQAAREADTWTNQVGNLKQAWSDFKATIGDIFLDKAVNVVKKISEFLIETTEKIPVISQWLQDFAMKLGVKLPNWDEIYNTINTEWNLKYWPAIQSWFYANFQLTIPKWSETEAALLEWWTGSSTSTLENIKAFARDAVAALNSVYEWATGEGAGLLLVLGAVAAGFGLVNLAIGAMQHPFALLTMIAAVVIANWEDVKTGVSNTFDTVVSWLEKNWGTPLEAFRTNVIQPLLEKWQEVKGGIGAAITAVDNFLGLGLVSGWDHITNQIKAAWEGVAGAINSAFQAMQNFFGLSGTQGLGGGDAQPWYVKAHPEKYSFSGGGSSASLPTVGLNAAGAIFSKPTLFNTRLGYQMVGEGNEPEAVSPISVLQGYVSDAVAKQNAGIINALERVVDAIDNMNDNMGSNLRGALDGVSVGVNKREFGRLVKAVT